MALFLTKLLPVFIYPLGAALLGGGVGLILFASRLRRAGFAFLGLTLLSLWIASMPAYANWLGSKLESQYPAVPLETLPPADAAILLGGVLSPPLPPRVTFDLSDAADRVLEAWRLYRAGKVRHIVISGGNLPWQTSAAPEAELIADLLSELGVPRAVLVLETNSRNTHENAINTAEVFQTNGWKTGLLITSGAHMPRALATFRKAGLEVTAAATDIHVKFPLYESLLDFLPDADALARTTSAIKEIIGLRVYRYRGWA